MNDLKAAELKALLKRKFGTLKEASKQIGLPSQVAFSCKTLPNDHVRYIPFSLKEIQKIGALLEMTDEQFGHFFKDEE